MFTKDDIKQCFGKDSPQYVYTKIRRLADDNLIETIEEGEIQKEGGILVLKLAINR